MVNETKRPFAPWNWTPLFAGAGSLGALLLASFHKEIDVIVWPAAIGVGAVLLYFLVQCVARLIERRWKGALFAFLRLTAMVVLCYAAMAVVAALLFFSVGESEDHFADNLTIPNGIDIADPEPDAAETSSLGNAKPADEMQDAIRVALASPGSEVVEFTPSMPSLRRAATAYSPAFIDYVAASPDWHVFVERGNRFAARRWSYNGEPRDTLHGYISEFNGDAGFQTRCLLCLDCRQWSSYSVQHVEEGSKPVRPKMSRDNNLQESRVMIECGGVWVEIFEQSGKPERRVTKATIALLEREFAAFVRDPEAAVAGARARSRDLGIRLAGKDRPPFRLLTGMQPGIYGVSYALNPGEAGWIYLKAFEVSKGTPLSVDRLKWASRTRLAWSTVATERFGAKAGFTIYEGDWGKPYAARFEVWFEPDSGNLERKLAERIFKIEGWQR